jgi:hypothetical protein
MSTRIDDAAIPCPDHASRGPLEIAPSDDISIGFMYSRCGGGASSVMAGLAGYPDNEGALCPPDRDRRDKPGDDEPATMLFPLSLDARELLI